MFNRNVCCMCDQDDSRDGFEERKKESESRDRMRKSNEIQKRNSQMIFALNSLRKHMHMDAGEMMIRTNFPDLIWNLMIWMASDRI